MAIVFPKTLRTNARNLSWVAKLATHVDFNCQNHLIVLDFSELRDFDENLCAALGVIVNRWKSAKHRVFVRLNAPFTLSTIKRNGFLEELALPYSWYNYLPGFAPDRNILVEDAESKVYPLPYKRIERTDTEAQAKYVTEIFNEHWWPKMTPAVRDALASCILEVFNNAEEHSESEHGVFVCGHVSMLGQKQLRISIADAGIGFRAKIKKALGIIMTSSQAIAWGMKEGNTIRQEIAGGLGLKILKEFIEKNKGRLSVLSDSGYWEFVSGREKMCNLDYSFPGTLVTIVINIEDSKCYRLASELPY